MRLFTNTLFILCLLASACRNNNNPPKAAPTSGSALMDKERCSFNLPSNLELASIDTTRFSTEGYFKIHAKTSNNAMQLFVYNKPIDAAEELGKQKKALSNPAVFTPDNITEISHWGHYTGDGVVMEGVYNGGVVKGTIEIFTYTNTKRGLVVIRQTLSKSDESVASFDAVENSFVLK